MKLTMLKLKKMLMMTITMMMMTLSVMIMLMQKCLRAWITHNGHWMIENRLKLTVKSMSHRFYAITQDMNLLDS